MSVISLSWFKESGVVYIFIKFLVLCNDIQNVFRGEAVPGWAKKPSDKNLFYLNTSYGFEYKKYCVIKLSKLKCS